VVRLLHLLAWVVVLAVSAPVRAEDPWLRDGADGKPEVQLYFFWSLTCPHCTAAHPYIEAIPQARPWVRLHALELSRQPENVRRYETLAHGLGEQAAAVPALIFCGEMHVGWDGDEVTGAMIRQRLDACRARAAGGPATGAVPPAASIIDLPLIGALDPASLSLPALTLVLAGLDAFNPCAFFVLLFLLSMMAHQKSRARMLVIGGVFVAISGLMYFAFMAAWLNVFQLLRPPRLGDAGGRRAGGVRRRGERQGLLRLRAGAHPVDSRIEKARHLPPHARHPRRRQPAGDARRHGGPGDRRQLLRTAVHRRLPHGLYALLTLAELSPAGRYAYLAAYNLVYVVPLAAIVAVFAGTLGARKLSEREGRLLKLLSGLMMLGLGALLLLAPERVSQVGIAFGLMAVAVLVTWIAARLTRKN
jgi:hypothetical protein